MKRLENGECRRLRFEIRDKEYLMMLKRLRYLYEQNRAREQAKMLTQVYAKRGSPW